VDWLFRTNAGFVVAVAVAKPMERRKVPFEIDKEDAKRLVKPVIMMDIRRFRTMMLL
jgi:hypothetical protein